MYIHPYPHPTLLLLLKILLPRSPLVCHGTTGTTNRCNIDVRARTVGNIVFVGGGSMIPGEW